MNEHNMHPLTKFQSDFAAQNYEMVFTFLSGRKLDVDEYHDAVIMHYLRAVQVYNEHSALQTKPFADFAADSMEKAVVQHLGKLNRRHIAETMHAYEAQNRQNNVIALYNAA